MSQPHRARPTAPSRSTVSTWGPSRLTALVDEAFGFAPSPNGPPRDASGTTTCDVASTTSRAGHGTGPGTTERLRTLHDASTYAGCEAKRVMSLHAETGRLPHHLVRRVGDDDHTVEGEGPVAQSLLLEGALARCEPKRLRYRLLHVAGRSTRSGRAIRLHLPARWPWAADLLAAFSRLRALPAPG